MAIDPNAVGQKGQPSKRSWNSKDALLYAVGIGAGTDELQYTTENTKDVVQKGAGKGLQKWREWMGASLSQPRGPT